MVSADAPNANSNGRWNREKPTVKTRAMVTSMDTALPRMASAPFRSPAPRRMDARGAPPMPAKAEKAEIRVRMGKVTPTPVRAVFPTTAMWPI